ncbi:MAG: hypothetical protein HRT47_10310 [Candidatus Caenarcaniphilales bacterium]|nr:hypothetical protein [Candidatus Caenarcaniphilales bacterium]
MSDNQINHEKSVEFRSDTFKYFGFILMSPFGITILQVLLHNQNATQMFTCMEFILSIVLALTGLYLVDYALEILVKFEEKGGN